MTLNYIDYSIIAIVVGTLGLDLWLARKGEGNTISFRIALWSRQWPIIPFLVGVLCGHLFFPNRGFCH